MVDIEDKTNVPVEIMRVKTWDGNKAKKAKFLLSPQQLDKNSSGEPIKLKGSLTMSDNDWTYGTYNDGVFTPDTSVTESDVQG